MNDKSIRFLNFGKFQKKKTVEFVNPLRLPRTFHETSRRSPTPHQHTAISSFGEASSSFGAGNPVPGVRVGTGQHVLLYYSIKIRKLPSCT
jgi:hypothetical protein